MKLEKASKGYKQTTGKKCDEAMLAMTLYAMADDETTEKMDKDEKVDVENYKSMRDWFGTQWEKRAGRTMAKGHQTTSNRMNIGAVIPPEQPAQDSPPASAASAAPQLDPWAGSDPWSMAECQPCEGQDPWALDAFGKINGKGAKGGPRPPLACWTCIGLGHPASLCASAPGFGEAKKGPQCNVCRGYGHMGKDCASEGGGKFVAREKGKGKGKGGKGSYEGKGFSALDEYWPAAPVDAGSCQQHSGAFAVGVRERHAPVVARGRTAVAEPSPRTARR